MNSIIFWDLQLLGEGGDGGDAGTAAGDAGTATGVNAGDAALPDRLADLGVPQAVLDKRRKALERRDAAMRRQARPQQQSQPKAPETGAETPQPKAAEQKTPETPEAQPEQPAQSSAPTREALEADPATKKILDDYANERIRARWKDQKGVQDRLDAIQPAMELLASYYGMDTTDPSKIDLAEVSRRIVEDNLYYEDRAVRNGSTAEEERQKSMQALQQRQQQEIANRQHFENLLAQGEALKARFPNFDLQTELRNPAFLRLTAPGSMVSLEDAYYAVHRQEIMQAQAEAAQKAAMEAASRSIQAGQARPVENGSVPQSTPPAQVNIRDKSYREDLKRRIYAAAARGERIYPGT